MPARHRPLTPSCLLLVSDKPPEEREVLVLAIIDADERRLRPRWCLRERLLVKRKADRTETVSKVLRLNEGLTIS